MPSPFIKYIQNEQHYIEVISRVATVKHSLWIGTADIKDLYVMKGKEAVPFLSTISRIIEERRRCEIDTCQRTRSDVPG